MEAGGAACRAGSGSRAAGSVVVAGLVSLLLAGCGGGMMFGSSPPSGAPAPAGITREALVGNWGMASFHDDKDRDRTRAEARSQCRQPYVIALGPRNGVMMHVADDAAVYELRLKAGADGRTYVGFEAPAGHPQDREILSITDSELVMRFVDPDAHRRYGTFIFVRCT